MDGALSEEILGSIEDEQPLVDAIRHFMFTFEDLLLLDAMAMQEVVAKFDRKLLVVALKGTSDQLKNLSCSACRSAAPRCCAKTWRPPVRFEFATSRLRSSRSWPWYSSWSPKAPSVLKGGAAAEINMSSEILLGGRTPRPIRCSGGM